MWIGEEVGDVVMRWWMFWVRDAGSRERLLESLCREVVAVEQICEAAWNQTSTRSTADGDRRLCPRAGRPGERQASLRAG